MAADGPRAERNWTSLDVEPARASDAGGGLVTLPSVSVSVPPEARDDFEARYQLVEVLGQGGMGDVFAARDQRIGREVAVKAARIDGSDDVLTRFNRECRLQGQLEHPGVVPVYDLGKMTDGAPFFTMKRIRGDSLESVLRRLAQGEARAAARFTRARLLAAFVTVCQTLRFAHRSGVVHRDLKPANVMLGDFGEVYVIDWGIAKVLGSKAANDAGPTRTPSIDPVAGHATSNGELLGTLGYMAPEQLADARSADARSDIYSLGAILFEMLTHERLHPSDKAVEVAGTTVRAVEERVRNVMGTKGAPPELVEVVVRATRLEPDARYASVDELLAGLQRFLDGDRDVEARSKLAEQEARLALRALEAMRTIPASREVALQHAGRALALSPSHALAQEVIVRLMLDDPQRGEEPEDVRNDMERVALSVYKRGAKVGALLHAMWLPFIIALAFIELKHPASLIAWAVLDLTAIGLLVLCSRVKQRAAPLHFLSLVACLLATDSGARIVGPFITVPGVVTLTTVTFLMLGRPAWHLPTVVIGAIALAGPFLLEALHIVEPTTFFATGQITIVSPVVAIPPATAVAALTTGTVVLFAVLCLAARYFQRVLLGNARKNALVQWKLASLVPRGVVSSTAGTPSR